MSNRVWATCFLVLAIINGVCITWGGITLWSLVNLVLMFWMSWSFVELVMPAGGRDEQ